jgi:ABC-type glycerol-3-phosphate transport system substrate-binding protein
MPLDGEVFLIPQHTDRARDAFALMQWTLSHEAQVAQILNGGLSVRPSSFADPRVTALPKAHQNRPYMPIWIFPTLAATTWSPSVPSVSEFNQITDAMSSGLSRVLAGDLTPRAGLDDIAIRLAEILKGKATLRYPPRTSRSD